MMECRRSLASLHRCRRCYSVSTTTREPWTDSDSVYFEVVHRSRKPGSFARVGRIVTPHGVINTPAFVPVGTNGSLKTLNSQQISTLGPELMFCNTYHLLVHPGADIVANAGGLHRFMNYDRPLITDSGGFQVFSMAQNAANRGAGQTDAVELKGQRVTSYTNSVLKITEDGVRFRSYRDGRIIDLSPEISIQAQRKIGADLMVAFDELLPHHVSPEKLKSAFERTHRWQKRSLVEHASLPGQNRHGLYGVVHGGTDRDLRSRSLQLLVDDHFDGIAIGGSVGSSKAEMYELLHFLAPKLPSDRPVHLLGIADPSSIEAVVQNGIDTFDSCYPTRSARHGQFFIGGGHDSIKKGKYKDLHTPFSSSCDLLEGYTYAYVHHLLKQHEPTLQQLLTIHNVHYMVETARELRHRILADDL